MSFFTGFEKVADLRGAAKAVGRFMGRGRGRVTGAGALVGREAKETGKAFAKEYGAEAAAKHRAMLGKSELGRHLAAKELLKQKDIPMAERVKMMPSATAEAQKKIKERAKAISELREKKKPTWIEKHPYMAAGGGLLAGKMLFGEKDEQTPASASYRTPVLMKTASAKWKQLFEASAPAVRGAALKALAEKAAELSKKPKGAGFKALESASKPKSGFFKGFLKKHAGEVIDLARWKQEQGPLKIKARRLGRAMKTPSAKRLAGAYGLGLAVGGLYGAALMHGLKSRKKRK